MILLWIVVILALFSVGSAYGESLISIIDSIDTFRMNQVVDSCKAMIVKNGNMSDSCYNFFAAYHNHMTRLFAENKEDIIKILVGP